MIDFLPVTWKWCFYSAHFQPGGMFIVKTGGDAVFSMKVQTAWRIWTTLMRTKNLRLKQALEASEAQILFLFWQMWNNHGLLIRGVLPK